MRSILFLVCLGVITVAAGLVGFDLYRKFVPSPAGTGQPREIGVSSLEQELESIELFVGLPVYIRIFKQSSELELWVREKEAAAYRLLRTYPICAYSGDLGPKLKEGDRQSPEGFYEVRQRSLNPNSQYHLSFNLGFPNAYDRFWGRTGSYLMVHGNCLSAGCYAMTDPGIDEIYRFVASALDKGQEHVPVHAFPFRMTQTNLELATASPWIDFWNNLAEGDRIFQQTGLPPVVGHIEGRYVFSAANMP